LYQAFNGGRSIPYSQIASDVSGRGYRRIFLEGSKVPYLYNGSSFISYDDPESIERKAAYIREQGLAGAMIWELSQDTADHDLLNALYKGLR
jgi:chitinase